MSRMSIVLGILVVLLTNGIALVQIAANRRNLPQQVMELTESELPMQVREEEDSSVSLRLNWVLRSTGAPARVFSRESVFDAAKLRQLGFDCETPASEAGRPHHPMPRTVFVAFEYAPESAPGLALVSSVAGQDTQAGSGRNINGDVPGVSHFVLADADRDFNQLRGRYPDSRRFLILEGVARAAWEGGRDSRSREIRPYRWSGYLVEVLPLEIHVPLPYSGELRRLKPRQGNSPRYSVTLSIGADFSPRVTSVRVY